MSQATEISIEINPISQVYCFSSCSQQMLSLEKVWADHFCGSKLSTEKPSLRVTVTVCTFVDPTVFGVR